MSHRVGNARGLRLEFRVGWNSGSFWTWGVSHGVTWRRVFVLSIAVEYVGRWILRILELFGAGAHENLGLRSAPLYSGCV